VFYLTFNKSKRSEAMNVNPHSNSHKSEVMNNDGKQDRSPLFFKGRERCRHLRRDIGNAFFFTPPVSRGR
jgi:hypothetical protein